jgi:hypothetical protein
VAESTDFQGQEKAYQSLLPKAEALPAEGLVTFRADSQLALQNIKTGLDNVLPQLDKIKQRLTTEEINTLHSLLDIAQALVFADSRVNNLLSRSDGQIAEKLAEGYRLRRILLAGAKACSYADLLTNDEAKELAKIELGQGSLDASQDCVDLAAMYNQSAVLMENTPATKEMIQDAARVGSELVLSLRSDAAPRDNAQPEKLSSAVSTRERFWTLLVQGHELLLQAGTLLFGTKGVYQSVPKLQSREIKPRAKKSE